MKHAFWLCCEDLLNKFGSVLCFLSSCSPASYPSAHLLSLSDSSTFFTKLNSTSVVSSASCYLLLCCCFSPPTLTLWVLGPNWHPKKTQSTASEVSSSCSASCRNQYRYARTCACGLQAMTASPVMWLSLIVIGKYLTACINITSRWILWMPRFRKHSYRVKANEPDISLLDFQVEIPTVVYCFAGLSKHSAVTT